MSGWLSRSVFSLCLAYVSTLHAGATVPVVLKSKAQLDALLGAGQRTPLDALTPHGKRLFLSSIRWGRGGLAGFDSGVLKQELDSTQLTAALIFLDSGDMASQMTANLVGAPVRLPAPSATLERELGRLNQLAEELSTQHAASRPAASRGAALALVEHYERTFGAAMRPAGLKQASLGDLPLLFEAAALVGETVPGAPATEHVQQVHQELAARGVDTRRTFDDTLLYVLLAGREFDKARAFAGQRPELADHPIPAVADPLGASFTGRSVYVLDATGKLLTRNAAPLESGLVMVVGPGCRFSRLALAAIQGDPVLKARLQKAGLMLLVSPRMPIPVSHIAEWNQANPEMAIRVPVRVGEWPEIANAGTPEFFRFSGGKVTGHLVGWPQGGQSAALHELVDGMRE